MKSFLDQNDLYQLDYTTGFDIGRDAWQILEASLSNQGNPPNYRYVFLKGDEGLSLCEKKDIPYLSNYFAALSGSYESGLCGLLLALRLVVEHNDFYDENHRRYSLYSLTHATWKLVLGITNPIV